MLNMYIEDWIQRLGKKMLKLSLVFNNEKNLTKITTNKWKAVGLKW